MNDQFTCPMRGQIVGYGKGQIGEEAAIQFGELFKENVVKNKLLEHVMKNPFHYDQGHLSVEGNYQDANKWIAELEELIEKVLVEGVG